MTHPYRRGLRDRTPTIDQRRNDVPTHDPPGRPSVPPMKAAAPIGTHGGRSRRAALSSFGVL